MELALGTAHPKIKSVTDGNYTFIFHGGTSFIILSQEIKGCEGSIHSCFLQNLTTIHLSCGSEALSSVDDWGRKQWLMPRCPEVVVGSGVLQGTGMAGPSLFLKTRG